MRILYVFIFLILSTFFMGFMTSDNEKYKIPKSELVVNALLNKISSFFTKKYKLRTIGESAAMPGGVIKELGLEFHICGPLTKEEIRKILVECVKEFVFFVNENVEIKSYLENYPFNIANVEITYFIVDSNGRELDKPNIGLAGISKGKLKYMYLVTSEIPSIKSIVTESYEDALRAIQVNNSP